MSPIYRRDNHYLRIDGVEKTLTEWAEIASEWGVSRQVIEDRMKRWLAALNARVLEYTAEEFEIEKSLVLEQAVFTPARRYNRRSDIERGLLKKVLAAEKAAKKSRKKKQ